MPFIVPPRRKFELAPAGTHRARCFRFIDLGTHVAKYGPCRLIRLDFELPDELMADGRPFSIARTYYAPTMGEKNQWRRDADAWLNLSESEREGFDMTTVVDKPALLTVVHETRDETYATIASITALPRSMAPPEPINNSVVFLLEEFNQATFDRLPDKVKEKIMGAREWSERRKKDVETKNPGATNTASPDFNQDINF